MMRNWCYKMLLTYCSPALCLSHKALQEVLLPFARADSHSYWAAAAEASSEEALLITAVFGEKRER